MCGWLVFGIGCTYRCASRHLWVDKIFITRPTLSCRRRPAARELFSPSTIFLLYVIPSRRHRRLRRFLNEVVPPSVTRANHILADSQATKDDLIELYNTPPDKVTVLYSGVDSRFSPHEAARRRGAHSSPLQTRSSALRFGRGRSTPAQEL